VAALAIAAVVAAGVLTDSRHSPSSADMARASKHAWPGESRQAAEERPNRFGVQRPAQAVQTSHAASLERSKLPDIDECKLVSRASD